MAKWEGEEIVHLARTMLDIWSGNNPSRFLGHFRPSHAYITTCLHHMIKGLQGQSQQHRCNHCGPLAMQSVAVTSRSWIMSIIPN